MIRVRNLIILLVCEFIMTLSFYLYTKENHFLLPLSINIRPNRTGHMELTHVMFTSLVRVAHVEPRHM
jgi:hypothetical protein